MVGVVDGVNRLCAAVRDESRFIVPIRLIDVPPL